MQPTRTGRFSVSNRYFSIYARTTSRIRLFFYACQFRVDHDTTTVFANDHFLTQLDIQLFLEQIISETKQDEEKLREKAKKLEANIEPRLLTAFKRIRKGARNGLAVVYVQRGACGGCFNKIPPQKQLTP